MMMTPREKTELPASLTSGQRERPPVSKVRTIINWIVETDRRFRMSQDRIDSLSDRL